MKCYKCSVFTKKTYEECVVPDKNTATEVCKDGEVCIAIGYNHVRNETYSEFTNIRRCARKNICATSLYVYGEENIRNCQECVTNLCNAGPLVPKPHLTARKPNATAIGVKPNQPRVQGGTGGSTNGSVKANGGAGG